MEQWSPTAHSMFPTHDKGSKSREEGVIKEMEKNPHNTVVKRKNGLAKSPGEENLPAQLLTTGSCLP